MAILITGGTGFIGLAIAEALLARGQEVILFGAAPAPDNLANHPSLAGAKVVLGDIGAGGDLDRAFAGGIEAVIHGAAITPDADMESRDPDRIANVNIGGTIALLSKARAAGVQRVLALSSVAVYGYNHRIDGPELDEDKTPAAPQTLYGITKLAAERTALRLADLWQLDLRVVRLGPAFGPWEYSTGVRPVLSPHRQVMDLAHAGKPCVLPRDMAGDFIYSRDAGRAVADLLECEHPTRRVFNLGGPVNSVAAWCGVVEHRMSRFDWHIDPAAPTIATGIGYDRAVLDSRRISAEIGFKTRDGLADLLDDYLNWQATIGIGGGRE